MEKFCIVTNKSKDKNLEITSYIRKFLEERSKVVTFAEAVDKKMTVTNGREFMSDIPEDSDCCIVLGGDGTMLEAARSLAFLDIPIIGINLGTMGYLTEIEKSGIDEALEKLIAGEYETEDRMMLRGCIGDRKDYALNDIVVSRSASVQSINYNIYVNNLLLCSYHADGIIISTPTGSTGYNMSAGGPIVEPSADMILLTPICPHTLNSRSVVLRPDTKIEIEITGNFRNPQTQVVAAFDGSGILSMNPGDIIEIKRSKKTTKILRLNRVSFLEVLSKKFSM